MNNVKIELGCPTCGTTFRIRTNQDWGLEQKLVFTCNTCGKGVITLGLHCPSDLNLSENTPDNCEYAEE